MTDSDAELSSDTQEVTLGHCRISQVRPSHAYKNQFNDLSTTNRFKGSPMVAKQLKSPNTAEENGLSPLVRKERSNTTNSSKGRLSRKTTYTMIQGNLHF